MNVEAFFLMPRLRAAVADAERPLLRSRERLRDARASIVVGKVNGWADALASVGWSVKRRTGARMCREVRVVSPRRKEMSS